MTAFDPEKYPFGPPPRNSATLHNPTKSPSIPPADDSTGVAPKVIYNNPFELRTNDPPKVYKLKKSSTPLDDEAENPPPVPDDLKYRFCYYGFEFTDAEIAKYAETNADERGPYPHGPTFHKEFAAHEHAAQLGISHRIMFSEACTRRKKDPLSSKEDLVWFTNVNHPYMCPTKAKIDELRERLGVLQEARWHVVN